MFIPSHLQKTKYGIYHFRLSVPSDLRCLLEKREIKISLNTGVQSEAIRKSFELKANTVELFKHLRTKKMSRIRLSDLDLSKTEERKKVIDAEYEHKFLQISMRPLRFSSLPIEIIKDDAEFTKALIDKYSMPTADQWFQDMLTFHQLEIKGSPVLLSSFRHEFFEMYKCFVKNAQKRFLLIPSPAYVPPISNAFKPEFNDYIQQEAPKAKPVAVEIPKEASRTPSILLSELIEKFLIEKAKDKSWTENTKKESESIFSLIKEIIGDIPVNSIGHNQANDLKTTFLKLPRNMNKSPLYRSKTIEEVLKMKPIDTLSVKTINKRLGLISSLFLYGQKHGYVDKNCFGGLCLKKTGKDSEKRDIFDNADLKKLFSSSIFTGKKPKDLYQYWLPLLALYTGARLEELCQLSLDDIRLEKEVWVIDINLKKDANSSSNKHLKNPHSVRLIPIHSKLIELGLLDYVESLRKKKETRVFPELKKRQNKYGHYPSRWFGDYRKKCGVADDSKVFHSFRHTAINFWKQKGVEREQAEAISGHGDTSISYGTYGKAYDVTVLKGVVEILDFNEVLKCVIPFGKT